MPIIVDDEGRTYIYTADRRRIRARERSAEEDFPYIPIPEQIEVLRVEMWEWMTGRSYFSPSTYPTADGPIPKKQAYAQSMIVRKATMIETLLKVVT